MRFLEGKTLKNGSQINKKLIWSSGEGPRSFCCQVLQGEPDKKSTFENMRGKSTKIYIWKDICVLENQHFKDFPKLLEMMSNSNPEHMFWKYLATPFAGWWKSCKKCRCFTENYQFSLLADKLFCQNNFWNFWTKMFLPLARNLHFLPASIRQMQLCYHWKEAILSFCSLFIIDSIQSPFNNTGTSYGSWSGLLHFLLALNSYQRILKSITHVSS